MRKNLNQKKVLVLTCLIALVGILFAYNSFMLKPGLAEDRSQLRSTTTQLSQTQNKIADIQEEVELFNEKQEEYEILVNEGFMDRQKRRIVRKALDKAKRLSGILDGSYQISPASCYLNEDLKGSDYVIVGSPVSMKIDSYEDISIYEFLDVFHRQLPGFSAIEVMETSKVTEMSANILQKIGTGQKVPLIRANFDLTWYTIVDRQEIECSEF